MINYLWGLFILIGIFYSLINGNLNIINNEIITSGSIAIDMILKLIPIICLWLGLINIAKESGLLNIIAKKISPFIGKIFKEIPPGHEALSFISSNIVMNMMGLANAATPFGLKAMKSLQELNKKKDVASRSMITFLVINTASVTIIPTTIISLRLLHGSSNPSDILLVSIITSFGACLFGLLLDRLCYWLGKKI